MDVLWIDINTCFETNDVIYDLIHPYYKSPSMNSQLNGHNSWNGRCFYDAPHSVYETNDVCEAPHSAYETDIGLPPVEYCVLTAELNNVEVRSDEPPLLPALM